MTDVASLAERKLPHKKTGQGCHSKALRGYQLYPTPACLTEALLRHEILPSVLWEPAAGMGHMAAVLTKAGHRVVCTDLIDYGRREPASPAIKTGRDFLQAGISQVPTGISMASGGIITNPPFEQAADFVRHGLTLCNKVYILGRLAFLESAGRSDILDRKLARVLVFKERPPMMHRWHYDGEFHEWREWEGKKAESAMPFAWFCFESGYDGSKQGVNLRRISWRG